MAESFLRKKSRAVSQTWLRSKTRKPGKNEQDTKSKTTAGKSKSKSKTTAGKSKTVRKKTTVTKKKITARKLPSCLEDEAWARIQNRCI
jgi:hypothetical protein